MMLSPVMCTHQLLTIVAASLIKLKSKNSWTMVEFKLNVYAAAGESQVGMAVGPAHTLLAVLEWEGLRAEADLVEKALVSADLKLRQFSLSRSTLTGKADDQGKS